jgi:hypothetical protein
MFGVLWNSLAFKKRSFFYSNFFLMRLAPPTNGQQFSQIGEKLKINTKSTMVLLSSILLTNLKFKFERFSKNGYSFTFPFIAGVFFLWVGLHFNVKDFNSKRLEYLSTIDSIKMYFCLFIFSNFECDFILFCLWYFCMVHFEGIFVSWLLQ